MIKFQCHQCGSKFEAILCPTCKTDAHLLNMSNPMDAFIANGGFDKAMAQAAESLPESVVKSLGEVS